MNSQPDRVKAQAIARPRETARITIRVLETTGVGAVIGKRARPASGFALAMGWIAAYRGASVVEKMQQPPMIRAARDPIAGFGGCGLLHRLHRNGSRTGLKRLAVIGGMGSAAVAALSLMLTPALAATIAG